MKVSPSIFRRHWKALVGAGAAATLLFAIAPDVASNPDYWRQEWSNTDFSRHSIDLDEIVDVLYKDAIPAIDDPRFIPVAEADHLADTEPVIGVGINGDFRAYPLQVLMRHEIVNDTVGGVPVAVTYCPLCNAAIVFDRRLAGRVLDFGTTGKLRHSDLVMYDRQTESWWQQFLGEGIVGAMTGERLEIVPARIESVARFRARAPEGRVLVPQGGLFSRYGENPYDYYDSQDAPYGRFFQGKLPEDIAPLARVVTIDGEAWSLDLVRERGTIRVGDDIVITWEPGQNSALDTPLIQGGFDVGNVVVQKQTPDGPVDIPYGVDFAFAFHAFYPEAAIHVK